MKERNTSQKRPIAEIFHTFRFREETLLRMVKQYTCYVRAGRVTSWSDFFDLLVETRASVDPESVRDDADRWPGGRVLTRREQQLAEERLIATFPQPMLTRTFREAFRAVKRMPFGPERAKAFADLIDNWNSGEIGQEADIDHETRRAHRRKIVVEGLEREQTRAQQSDGDRSGPATRHFVNQLDPKNRVGLPPYDRLLELGGPAGRHATVGGSSATALPEPRRALPAPRKGLPDAVVDSSSEPGTPACETPASPAEDYVA